MNSILYFASQNQHKIEEINLVLEGKFHVQSILSLGQHQELEESGKTFEANALQKARFIYQKFKVNCFADDSGLEVQSLNNEPGVFSARYAGPQRNAIDNMNLLLKNLEAHTNRNACFKTVIALILDGNEFVFEGKIEGKIIHAPQGENGFGYDPIFIPLGYEKTFAEMLPNEKKEISHRAIAVQKMAKFLKENAG